MLDNDIAIISYSRTPVGKFGLSLKDIFCQMLALWLRMLRKDTESVEMSKPRL
jgi:hypothetical protein